MARAAETAVEADAAARARPRSALARARGLAEAARLVGANGHDLDATLDALAAQARVLLGADHAGVHLAVERTGAFVRRLPSRLAELGAAFTRVGAPVEPDDLVRAAIAARRPLFAADYQADARVAPAWRVGRPTIVAGLAAPLFAGDELVGYLFACWTRPYRATPADIDLAEALGRHAAVAIRTARLLDDARRARAEAEARLRRLEAAQRVSAAVAAAGDLDEVLRALLAEAVGLVGHGTPVTAAALRAAAAPRRPDGSVPPVTLLDRALAGRRVAEELVWRAADGAERRLHVVAVPVRDGADRIWAAVVVAHDVTVLHDAISARERLDGAVKTARRVAHELNNQLAPVRGYGEVLAETLEGEPGALAARVMRGAEAAAATIVRLQRIVRFEETVSAGQPMLDLDASTNPKPRGQSGR